MPNSTLLFNPTSLVHDRNIAIFEKRLPQWKARRIYNPRLPWFPDRIGPRKNACLLGKGPFPRLPSGIFDDVVAVILFTAQSRVPPAGLIESAALRSIPVIAIEEVYMLMLEYGYINNYCLPVDHLFAASEYERMKFIELGIPESGIETTGCIFNYNKPSQISDDKKKTLKRNMGLSDDKLTATLSLSFLFSGGETLEIRRDLITTISKGLPDGYQLLIKPHPSEEDRNLAEFVRSCASGVTIADKRTPIGDILDVTDILFNRGNSQVIVDALRRGIPAVCVPAGRKTFFHEMLPELIVESHNDVARVLSLINRSGFGLYKDIFVKYLNISPEDALKRAMELISEIAEKKEVRDLQGRLMELALFWAWMGYRDRALNTVKNSVSKKDPAGLSGTIWKLISGRADKDDIMILKKWSRGHYKEWIIKSLWIKTLHMKDNKIDREDREWLGTFPPEMNRAQFIPYAVLLYWRYVRSGMHEEARALVESLSAEFASLKEIDALRTNVSNMTVNPYFNPRYWKGRFDHYAIAKLKGVFSMMGGTADPGPLL